MEKEVTRKCIVCGEVKPKSELLRFAVVNGDVLPDFKKKLAGEGIYVSFSKTALQTAVSKNLFGKVTRGNAHADAGLVDIVDLVLKKKCLDMISLARKAGCLITGFDKVKEALAKHKAAFILEAKDCGCDGHQKIVSLAQGLDVFALFTIEELDKALDKINTVHAAFLIGKMADAVKTELEHYMQFLDA